MDNTAQGHGAATRWNQTEAFLILTVYDTARCPKGDVPG